jgi:uncharacterized iron-regulated membrane protein
VNPLLIRRLHRWLGLVFSVTVFMSAASGILHTVMSRTQSPPPPARPSGVAIDASKVTVPLAGAVAKLPDSKAVVEAVNIRQIGGEPWYQIYVRGTPGAFYVNASSGVLDKGQDEAYAAQVAAEFLGDRYVRKTDYLTKFNAEYVNIFRILPVYRFDANDGRGTRVYVSTTTGSVTRHTDDSRQFEASVFSNFHKWMFICDKDTRDVALVAVTSGILAVSCLGIMLFFLTRPPRCSANSAPAWSTARPNGYSWIPCWTNSGNSD